MPRNFIIKCPLTYLKHRTMWLPLLWKGHRKMTSFCNWRAPVPLSSHIHTRISARIYCPRIRKPWGQKKIFSIIPHILTAQLVKNPSAIQETPSSILGLGRSSGEGIGYPFQYSWASLVAQLVKNPPAMWETWVRSWVGKMPWRRERLPTPLFWPGEFEGLYSLWGRK